MKIFFRNWAIICIIAFMNLAFASCNSNNDDEPTIGNEITGWYVCKNDVAKTSDFNSINNAIENIEVMYEDYDGYQHYATRDKFFSGHAWDDSHYTLGKYRNSIKSAIIVINIINDNTLVKHWASLYENGGSNDEVVYKLYGGKYIGDLEYCGEGRVYSYIKSDNKIILTDSGDIYTIVNGGLLKEGSSTDSIMEKYDPNKLYGEEQKETNSNDSSNNTNDTQIKQLIEQNVSIKASYSEYMWNFEITSTLHNALPNKKIQFCIGHGVIEDLIENVTIENQTYYYSYKTYENVAYITFKNPFWYYYALGTNPANLEDMTSAEFYYPIYINLVEKGLSNLTTEEYNYYKELKKILDEYESPTRYSYKPSVQVLIDAKKYYLIKRYSR